MPWSTIGHDLLDVENLRCYIESRGDRRVQLRHLLKYLFFWGSHHPRPQLLAAQGGGGDDPAPLGKRTGAARSKRLARAESLVLRLASSLAKIAIDLRLASQGRKSALTDALLGMARDSEALLKEAEYFDVHPRPSQRKHVDEALQIEEAHRGEKLILRLVNMLEQALTCLDHAVYRLGPLDAHRARHIMRQSHALLLEIHPDSKPKSPYAPAAVTLSTACSM